MKRCILKTYTLDVIIFDKFIFDVDNVNDWLNWIIYKVDIQFFVI